MSTETASRIVVSDRPVFDVSRGLARRALLVAALVAVPILSQGETLDVRQADPVQAPRPFAVDVHAPDDPSGHHIILIPGLGNSALVWNRTVDALRSYGHTLHVLTLAGFAGQASVEGELLPQVHQALIDYARPLDRPAVIGHSLGGAMAFWVSSTAPSVFGPIIAVDGVPFLPALMQPGATEESARPGAEQFRDMLTAMTPEAYERQTVYTLSTMITDPEDTRWVAEISKGSDPKAVASAVHDLMTRDLRDDVAAITSPVMLIAAGAPAPTGDAAEDLRRRYAAQITQVPDHRLEVVASARHFVMLDAPERFLELVREHLSESFTAKASTAEN